MFGRLGTTALVGASLLVLAACGDDAGDGTGGGGGGSSSTSTTSSSAGGAGGDGGSGETGGGGQGAGHFQDNHAEGHACVHLDQGPFAPLTATASAASAPIADTFHTAYEVTLNEAGGGSHDGFIRFDSSEDTEVYVFLSEDVDVSFTDAQGMTIDPEGSCQAAPCSSVCAAIKNKYKLDLSTGLTTLSFGPTSTHDLMVLFEEAGHSH